MTCSPLALSSQVDRVFDILAQYVWGWFVNRPSISVRCYLKQAWVHRSFVARKSHEKPYTLSTKLHRWHSMLQQATVVSTDSRHSCLWWRNDEDRYKGHYVYIGTSMNNCGRNLGQKRPALVLGGLLVAGRQAHCRDQSHTHYFET